MDVVKTSKFTVVACLMHDGRNFPFRKCM